MEADKTVDLPVEPPAESPADLSVDLSAELLQLEGLLDRLVRPRAGHSARPETDAPHDSHGH